MTDISRRRLFGAAAATGLAAAVPAHAARVDADEELLNVVAYVGQSMLSDFIFHGHPY